jgi:DNA-binding NtrC family response regulator
MNVKKILLVDDEPEILEMLEILLLEEFPGAQLTMTSNVREAVQHLNERHFDLIICDHLMPGQRGINLYELNQEKYGLPFIMLTGSFAKDAEELLKSFKQNEQNKIIFKPFDQDEFLGTIADMVDINTF